MSARAAVLDALSTVRDPELDEPITDLGFVVAVEFEGRNVSVTLRLPTYFCAPNFAFMMAADAKRALQPIKGIDGATIRLIDHHASDDINAGLADGLRFEETFPGDATEGLDDLRELFRRKAFIARQERLARHMERSGMSVGRLAALTLGQLPQGEETDRYLEHRAALGIDTSPTDPFLVGADGNVIPEESIVQHLRFARTVRISIEGNADFCRGLLKTRYAINEEAEA
jgi:metal-sulfur cluster biosynthetic enzyme